MNCENAKMVLPSKEVYISGFSNPTYEFRKWSEPRYKCSKCEGGMCKNLQMVCSSLPPMYIYRCNKCGHTDYLDN